MNRILHPHIMRRVDEYSDSQSKINEQLSLHSPEAAFSLRLSLDTIVERGMGHLFQMRDELTLNPRVLLNITNLGVPMILPNSLYPDASPSQDDTLSKYFTSFGFTLVGTYDVEDYVSEYPSEVTPGKYFLTSITSSDDFYINDTNCYINSLSDEAVYLLGAEMKKVYLSFECSSNLNLDCEHSYFISDVTVNVLFREAIFNVTSPIINNLTFSSVKDITEVGDDFLNEMGRLRRVDMSSLSGVMRIGDDFLGDSGDNLEIDLTPLGNVLVIGDNFLNEQEITRLDLTPLKNVEVIGDNFLAECQYLKELKSSSMRNLHTVGDDFLVNSSVEGLDLSSLTNLTTIGSGFLSKSIIDTIDLTFMSNVEEIPNGFLSECYKLKSLDLSPLSNVRNIGDEFLTGCYNLSELDLTPLSGVVRIGENFLSTCTSLTEIDLSVLTSLELVGEGFLDKCEDLKKITLRRDQLDIFLPNSETLEKLMDAGMLIYV
jgi:hypothetical protein